jgi:hypothetical protein
MLTIGFAENREVIAGSIAHRKSFGVYSKLYERNAITSNCSRTMDKIDRGEGKNVTHSYPKNRLSHF